MVGELIMLPVRVGVRATRLWFRAVEETFSITTSAAGRVIGSLGSRSSNGSRATVVAPAQDAAHTFRPAASPPEPTVEPSRVAVPPPEPTAAPTPTAAPAPDAPPIAQPAPDAAPTAAPAPAPEAPLTEPDHVSEQPALVEEFAEPGAEEGAGAEVHVDAPWDGYQQMNAKQIVDRLAGADAAELAAVELYEVTNRRRQTILNAVRRELRRVNGSGSRGNRTQGG